MHHRWILGVPLALFPVLGKRGGEAAVSFVATEARDSAAIPGEGKSVQKAEPEEGNGGTRENVRPDSRAPFLIPLDSSREHLGLMVDRPLKKPFDFKGLWRLGGFQQSFRRAKPMCF